jgi:hypothetical protein
MGLCWMMRRTVLGHGLQALPKRLGPAGGSAAETAPGRQRRRGGPNELGQVLGGIGVVVGVAVLSVARGVAAGRPLLAVAGGLLPTRRQRLLLLLLQLCLLKPLPVQLLLDGLVAGRGAAAGIFQAELAIGDRDDALVRDDCLIVKGKKKKVLSGEYER